VRGRLPDARPPALHAQVPDRPTGSDGAALYPVYGWPLERGLRDGFVLVNYIDHDATTAIRDYQNGTWSYDGHNGTDIALYNFRLMDRGIRIVAGASGTVFSTVWDKVDRSTGPPYPDTENNVLVDNGDGTTTWYLHLRRNSVTVKPGDVIPRGTVLGLVGLRCGTVTTTPAAGSGAACTSAVSSRTDGATTGRCCSLDEGICPPTFG
jgi:murein DD-endopeptidase MepM/ murein hydrolase activator NlpD